MTERFISAMDMWLARYGNVLLLAECDFAFHVAGGVVRSGG
jgi:hypothetical protein